MVKRKTELALHRSYMKDRKVGEGKKGRRGEGKKIEGCGERKENKGEEDQIGEGGGRKIKKVQKRDKGKEGW